jgi:tetratricopeptide (TPR) repeat protein
MMVVSLYSLRTRQERKPDYWYSQECLAVIYDKFRQHEDAEAELAKLKAALGDGGAYQYAAIYAQWGNRAKAIEWLETALRLRDPGLVQLKTDPLMEPLRQEPRFKAIERELKFPN